MKSKPVTGGNQVPGHGECRTLGSARPCPWPGSGHGPVTGGNQVPGRLLPAPRCRFTGKVPDPEGESPKTYNRIRLWDLPTSTLYGYSYPYLIAEHSWNSLHSQVPRGNHHKELQNPPVGLAHVLKYLKRGTSHLVGARPNYRTGSSTFVHPMVSEVLSA